MLHGVSPTFSFADLLGEVAGSQQFQSPRAKDAVWVVRLEDGETISYSRPDASWIHTLNAKEGFTQKLAQLGNAL